jgi:hypothetical protein
MFWFLPYELFEAFFFLIIALMISTIWVGVIAIKQTDKNKEKGKWIAILLTLLNVSLFIILSPVIIAFTL